MIFMKYQLCLFDLDGTLTDPRTGIINSYHYALSAFGITEDFRDMSQFIGPPLREVFRERYGFSEADAEVAVAKFREYFSVTGLLENVVFAGIDELLLRLKNGGAVMAVATSKGLEYSERILEHFQIDGYFSCVSGDSMDGSLTKDGKREVIRIAMDAVDPERKLSAVMIGDRMHDIIGAREMGIDSIGVTWGYGSHEELKNAGATWIVDSPEELGCLILGETRSVDGCSAGAQSCSVGGCSATSQGCSVGGCSAMPPSGSVDGCSATPQNCEGIST